MTQPADDRAGGDTPRRDPLRSSATSRLWVSVVALVVLLLLLVIFIAQNTGRVEITFLGWSGHPPLAVALLASAVAGLAIAVIAGTLRLWQLHRRVKRKP